jgi:hypothetical protein
MAFVSPNRIFHCLTPFLRPLLRAAYLPKRTSREKVKKSYIVHIRKYSVLSQGWLGTSFIPEHASLFFDSIAAGAVRAGRTIADLDLQVAGGVAAFSDDVESLIAPRKPGLAFTLGAMGSRQHNFYNDVYQRAGYADIALEVQDLWLKKQREAAAARVPDELVLKTNLIGTEAMVRERLSAHRRAGVNTLQVNPEGQTLDERLATLARLLELVKEVNAEP